MKPSHSRHHFACTWQSHTWSTALRSALLGRCTCHDHMLSNCCLFLRVPYTCLHHNLCSQKLRPARWCCCTCQEDTACNLWWRDTRISIPIWMTTVVVIWLLWDCGGYCVIEWKINKNNDKIYSTWYYNTYLHLQLDPVDPYNVRDHMLCNPSPRCYRADPSTCQWHNRCMLQQTAIQRESSTFQLDTSYIFHLIHYYQLNLWHQFDRRTALRCSSYSQFPRLDLLHRDTCPTRSCHTVMLGCSLLRRRTFPYGSFYKRFERQHHSIFQQHNLYNLTFYLAQYLVEICQKNSLYLWW